MTMNTVLSSLSDAADIIMRNIRDKVNANNVPSGIAEDMEKQPPAMLNEGTAYIDVVLSHPATLAFEFGSGERAERGKRERYEITPKSADMLAFPKERWPSYEPPPPAPDIFVFPIVHHPGVAATHYLSQALEASQQEVAELLGKAIVLQMKQDEEVLVTIEVK